MRKAVPEARILCQVNFVVYFVFCYVAIVLRSDTGCFAFGAELYHVLFHSCFRFLGNPE